MSAESCLDVVDLQLRRGSRDVLCGLTFSLGPGDIVALMGLSGSGKTTVLRAIAGLEPFDAGTIRVGGATLAAGTRRSTSVLRPLRREVGMVFQFHHLFEHLSALDNVCLAQTHVGRRSRDEAVARARRLLADLGVGARADALPRELSGGEAQRVAIARAASLDPARRGELGRILQKMAADGRALLVTCHDDDFVLEYASTVVVLSDGCVVERGDPRQVLTNPAHAATRALLAGEHPKSAMRD